MQLRGAKYHGGKKGYVLGVPPRLPMQKRYSCRRIEENIGRELKEEGLGKGSRSYQSINVLQLNTTEDFY